MCIILFTCCFNTCAYRDPHGIATKKDKILSVLMIGLAVFSNLMAIYSNVISLFGKK